MVICLHATKGKSIQISLNFMSCQYQGFANTQVELDKETEFKRGRNKSGYAIQQIAFYCPISLVDPHVSVRELSNLQMLKKKSIVL